MAIDKPAGMIVHGDGTGERTLTDYASDLLLAMGDGFAATDMQPLNRLDRDTTGVVLFSLDKQTQPAFDQMVIDHAFEKHYLALAEGKIDWNEKLIDKPIARDRHDSRKMRVGASGKPSQTRVKVLKRLKSRRGLPTRSYIDVELLTGRKHQIRVHLASERHPLVGDDLYGTPRPCGLMLHAHSVSFTHPVTGEHIHIEALPLGVLNHHKGSRPFVVVLPQWLSRGPKTSRSVTVRTHFSGLSVTDRDIRIPLKGKSQSVTVTRQNPSQLLQIETKRRRGSEVSQSVTPSLLLTVQLLQT